MISKLIEKMFRIVLLFFIFQPYFVAPEKGFVLNYSPSNFKERIEELDGNFIMFFAPWCQPCVRFHPIWQELGKLVNSKDSKFAIAQVDCTEHRLLCHENDITGYPTLLYFHKNSFDSIEYKGTHDLPSLLMFLSEVVTTKTEKAETVKDAYNDVKIYGGVAYLNDQNIEKFISEGQHFVMFYAHWCKESQKLAPVWAELAVQYTHNEYIQIGKVNCMESQMTCKNFDIKLYPYLLWIVNGRIMGVAEGTTLDELKAFVEKMLLEENHDPEKFMKKKKVLPVARITEETFETFLEKDLVFINYFAPWCAHCMQMGPLWLKLGENFQNESRVLIADIDCVRSKQICDVEKINGLPTLVLYKHKKIVNVEHGGRPLESLISLVKEHLKESSDIIEEVAHSDDNSNQNEDTKNTKDEL
ncbi:thioredoxin domain-containing protein 5 homolog [Ostrinia nubilalis]|uniref:thioredoxin domain-containing protein 5 homolog n=1 Tax=Ostrinia furnacalis TaxID=93504 RepID=UPI00103FE01B|nr:thioredoxin domain-containing protein 5 homolog [Ostrinia furnacalis]